MVCLPTHGRVDCDICHRGPVKFDQTITQDGQWRITANPLAWGNENAEIVVLGFSKGPTQAGALATFPHDEIAYKGSRKNVGKILAHVGLIPASSPSDLGASVDRLISDKTGRFHFGSLVRCTVERLDASLNSKDAKWKGTGGGMLDKFVSSPFGRTIAGRCTKRFLSQLPSATKLVVMFGLGTKGNYVREARAIIETARPGRWHGIRDVGYSDGKITFVHVEHFASQGSLIPDWLGETGKPRAELGIMAREAVMTALAK